MPINVMRHTLISSLLILLTACGGSSDNPPEPVNKAPVINTSDVETKSKSSMELVAQASDSDGTIASYQWSQKSGVNAVLSDTSSATLTFEVPVVTQEEILIFSLTVTDNDGDSTTKDIEVIVIPEDFAFTLSGKVITSSQIFAETPVTVVIGEQTFSSQTNELGIYTVDLANIEYANKDLLVTVSATNTTTNSIIKLTSYVDDVQSLASLAENNNKQVSHEQNHNLIVSSLTTAAAALMVRENNGNELITKTEFVEFIDSFDSGLFIKYAEIIEYIIDNIEDPNNLPDSVHQTEFTNTYDFIKNKEQATQLIYEINPRSLVSDSFINRLNNNRALLSAITNFNNDNDNDTTQFLYSTLGMLTLNHDGNGEIWSVIAGKQPITWENNEGGLKVTLIEPFFQGSSLQYTYEYGYQDVDTYFTGFQINKVLGNEYRDQVITLEQFRHVLTEQQTVEVSINEPNNGLYNATYISKEKVTFPITDLLTKQYVADFLNPKATTFINNIGQPQPGLLGAINLAFISETDASFTIDVINDAGDFSTTTYQATWEILEDGSIELSNDNWSISIIAVSEVHDKQKKILITTAYQDETLSTNTTQFANMYEAQSQSYLWTYSNVVGIYQYSSKNLDINPLATDWYELRADGTLSYINTLNSAPTPQSLDTGDIRESPGLWRIDGDKLIIRRFRNNEYLTGSTANCHSDTWETDETSACILYFQREWQLKAQYPINNTVHTIIQQRSHIYSDYYNVNSETDISFFGHLIEHVSSVLSNFIKKEERPIELPADYVLIKDR